MREHPIDKFLPPMRCDAGCGECCGVAPCSTSEYDRVATYAKLHGITPQRQGSTCPYYIDGTCSVYDARPAVCRLFGHVEDLECPRGYNVNVTNAGVLKRVRAILLDGGGILENRTLHEAVYTTAELLAVLQAEVDKVWPITVNGVSLRNLPNKAYHLAHHLEQAGHLPRGIGTCDSDEVEDVFGLAKPPLSANAGDGKGGW